MQTFTTIAQSVESLDSWLTDFADLSPSWRSFRSLPARIARRGATGENVGLSCCVELRTDTAMCQVHGASPKDALAHAATVVAMNPTLDSVAESRGRPAPPIPELDDPDGGPATVLAAVQGLRSLGLYVYAEPIEHDLAAGKLGTLVLMEAMKALEATTAVIDAIGSLPDWARLAEHTRHLLRIVGLRIASARAP